jgi:hypothetical protein
MQNTRTPNLDPFLVQGGVTLNSWLGWCLLYVQTAFSAGWSGASALDGWNMSAGKHQDRNLPSGVFVPIWFNHWGTYGGVYKNWGHVALYKDGRIWSSPLSHKPYADTFGSIGEIEQRFNAKYVGWTEFVGNTRVLEAAPAPAPIASNQRQVGGTRVFYRDQPKKAGKEIKVFEPNDVLTFKGFVNGETVDGNNKWFVGAFTNGYAWSGAFTNTSTIGLPDLTTPTDPLVKITNASVNFRSSPKIDGSNNLVIAYPAGSEIKMKAYLNGETVQNNSVWFVSEQRGLYAWSGGFTDQSTTGLPQYTPIPPATEPTLPPYNFTKDLACVTEVIPAHPNNFMYGNFPDKPEKAVIHDFGADGKDTYGSTVNWFKSPNSQVSAHFVVSGKKITQMVALKDRAYHAGPNGNNFVGIETDPKQDQDTINSTISILKELKDKYGYQLALVEHNQIMQTLCGDDVDLANYDISFKPPEVVEPPVTPPEPEKPPVEPPVASQTLLEFIKQLLSKLTDWLSQWRKDK